MKIILVFGVIIENCEISEEEFELNWTNQVPHWHYLTNEGISFFKGLPPRKWKEKQEKSISHNKGGKKSNGKQ